YLFSFCLMKVKGQNENKRDMMMRALKRPTAGSLGVCWDGRQGAMNAPQVCSEYEASIAPCARDFGLMAAISGWGLLKWCWPLRCPSGFPRCDVGGLPHLLSTSGHLSALGLPRGEPGGTRTDPAQTFVALASAEPGS